MIGGPGTGAGGQKKPKLDGKSNQTTLSLQTMTGGDHGKKGEGNRERGKGGVGVVWGWGGRGGGGLKKWKRYGRSFLGGEEKKGREGGGGGGKGCEKSWDPLVGGAALQKLDEGEGRTKVRGGGGRGAGGGEGVAENEGGKNWEKKDGAFKFE